MDARHKSPRCNHTLEGGRRCGSPAMKGLNFCYFHHRLRETWILPGHPKYQPPFLENSHSLQISLAHVHRALSKNLIGLDQARLILYGLKLAAANLKHLEPIDPDSIETELTPGMRHVMNFERDPDSVPGEVKQSVSAGKDAPGNLPSFAAKNSVHLTTNQLLAVCMNLPPDDFIGTNEQEDNLLLLRLHNHFRDQDEPSPAQIHEAMKLFEIQDQDRLETGIRP